MKVAVAFILLAVCLQSGCKSGDPKSRPKGKELVVMLGVPASGRVHVDSEEMLSSSGTAHGSVADQGGCRVEMEYETFQGDLLLTLKVICMIDKAGRYSVRGDYDSTVPVKLRLLGTGEQTEEDDEVLDLVAGKGRVEWSGSSPHRVEQ